MIPVSFPARRRVIGIGTLLLAMAAGGITAGSGNFRFVILGDRTGETQPGIYEQVWHEAASANPAFVIGTGDTIQGGNELTAQREWDQAERIRKPYARFPLYLAPGNHDIWSPLSERLFQQYAGRPPHYSFDYEQAHFTVLDNSRSDDLSAEQMEFLAQDLEKHAAQPVKFILSHRPSWLVPAALRSTGFPLHRLAKQYGIRYVIAGHVHQMMHIELDGVTYLSMPSSGGHLRASGAYDDGWFFGYAVADIQGSGVQLQIRELAPPHGQGRTSQLSEWGMLGRAR
jgi:3',5'-cyclic AMP phosphodiesterase CpdA